MTPAAFAAKWGRADLTERASYQQHFLDLCDLVGHPKPADVDPTGESFCFEKGASKSIGGEGFADVWKRDAFAFEYKGRHKDLDAAYQQLLQYREALGNPPLLVVCNTDRIVIHTNFTATVKRVHEITLATIGTPASLELLRHLFHDPERLTPGLTRQAITEDAAARFAALAQRLRDRGIEADVVARFLDCVVFCMFAEDVGLLPTGVFSRLLERAGADPPRLARYLGELFASMATGGDFLLEDIPWFNGALFADPHALELEAEEIAVIRDAAGLDWSAVDASIFGTLFERGLDPAKRAQIGAHYTSRADIELLVEPVVMQPLRHDWDETRTVIDRLLETGRKTPPARGKAAGPPTGAALRKALEEARHIKGHFLQRLSQVKVLDPACGSGNFLNVTLQKLLELEKEAVLYGGDRGVATDYLPLVRPKQLHGIEINRYAHELASVAVWIGYLQWTRHNGFPLVDRPLLKEMPTFENRDAILDLSDPTAPREPEWPKVDCIVGNPPFLGGKLLRSQLGDEYVDRLFAVYDGCVRREADLCCYWIEKARGHIERGGCLRAGLLATQGIRGGANRETIQRIKATGDVFFAISDREWVLDGANVHISMLGYDDGSTTLRTLDGRPVAYINANLTGAVDVTVARRLPSNANLSFMGDTKGGDFDIDATTAAHLLMQPNPSGRPTSDVVVPWVNGLDITRRNRDCWIVDFGCDLREQEAALYEGPFEHLRARVMDGRAHSRTTRAEWWLHERPRPAMRAALKPVDRFLATPTVAKHRLFVWISGPTLPDHQLIAVARDDDCAFGILHSRFHEIWARSQGTQVRERESGFRYTPTTCFETFPFPQPTPSQRDAIAVAAAALNRLRENWLNPPEWTREDVLKFPGSIDGPWARYVTDPNAAGVGMVNYARMVPADDRAARELKRRTLTALYNQRPTWLANAHHALDEAVAAAYGWPADLSDDDLLGRLLALNLERASGQDVAAVPEV